MLARLHAFVSIAAEFAAWVGDFNLVFRIAGQQMDSFRRSEKSAPGITQSHWVSQNSMKESLARMTRSIFSPVDLHGSGECSLYHSDSFHEFIREEDGNVHRRQLFFILFDMAIL